MSGDTGVRCVTYWAGVSSKFHLKGNTEIVPIKHAHSLEKKRGKVVTIVQ